MAAECAIFVGLPASGKTTFYQQNFTATHVHVSKDLWPRGANKATRQQRELEAALSAGRSVVVDNTSPSPTDRAPIIAAARRHGARVVGYYFASGTREAVARNRGRTGSARVPDVAIFTAAKRMSPPAYSEGFDELYRVTITPGGGFEVSPLTDAVS